MEITPPEDREICRSIDFAPRGPRDCPRAISMSFQIKVGNDPQEFDDRQVYDDPKGTSIGTVDFI